MGEQEREMSPREKAMRREQKELAGGWKGTPAIDFDRLEKEWGIKQWKPSEGTNFLSILPPDDPNAYIGSRIFIHRNIGPNRSEILCLNQNEIGDGRCPICERREELRRDPEADEKEAKDLNAWPAKHVFLILDSKNKTTLQEGVKVFVAGVKINDAVVKLSNHPRTGAFIDISDIEEGYDFIFTRTGTGMKGTRYSGYQIEERDPISDEALAQIAKMPPLEDFFIVKTYDEIRGEFSGSAPRGDDQESPPESSRRSRRSRGSESADESRRSRDREDEGRGDPLDELPEEKETTDSPEDIGDRVRGRSRGEAEPPAERSSGRSGRSRGRSRRGSRSTSDDSPEED